MWCCALSLALGLAIGYAIGGCQRSVEMLRKANKVLFIQCLEDGGTCALCAAKADFYETGCGGER